MNAPTLLIGLGGVGSKIVERVSGLITPDRERVSLLWCWIRISTT